MKFVDPKVDIALKIDEEQSIPEALAIDPAIKEAADTANQATWTKEEIAAYEHGLREEQKELDMIEELKQKKEELQESKQVISEKDKTIFEKDKTISEKDKMIADKEKALQKSVSLLLSLNQTVSEIAKSLNMEEEEVNRLL